MALGTVLAPNISKEWIEGKMQNRIRTISFAGCLFAMACASAYRSLPGIHCLPDNCAAMVSSLGGCKAETAGQYGFESLKVGGVDIYALVTGTDGECDWSSIPQTGS